MILTVCPNPSMDCTIEVDDLNVGMLNRISNKIETYSGKALNVAIGVARLGGDALATGFMFESNGRMFEHALDKEGVRHRFVWNAGSVRVNYKIIDKKSMLTEINDRGDEVYPAQQEELLELVEALAKQADIAVVSGSLPKGVPPAYYGRLLACIPSSVRTITDTETANLVYALKEKPYLVKPNLKELENYSRRTLVTHGEILSAAEEMLEAGAQNVLVSLGAEGAILTDGKKRYYCKSANIAINSTVGAGDSMIASACMQILKDAPLCEVLRHGVAAGTAAITTSGTNLFYRDKYEEIYSQISVQEL